MILANIFAVIYNYFGNENPMYVNIFWNCVFFGINIYHIALFLSENKINNLSEFDKQLFNLKFSKLKPYQFKCIIKLAEKMKFSSQRIIIKEDETVSHLFYVAQGKCSVYKNDQLIATIEENEFIGELSFLTDSKASATVKSEPGCVLMAWNQKNLKSKMLSMPEAILDFQRLVSQSLTSKFIDKNSS